MPEPDRRSFWRYLITPKGEATNLVLLFLITFIVGISQLGYLFQQLADFYQTLHDKSFLDVVSLLLRFFGSLFCVGISVHFVKEIYALYLSEK